MKTSHGHKVTLAVKKAGKALRGKTDRLRRLTLHEEAPELRELKRRNVELEALNEELRRARADLEGSQRRYAELYEFSPAGYFTYAEDGTIVETNRTAADMLGLDKESLLGQAFPRFIMDGPGRELFGKRLREVLDLHKARTVDLRLERKDGAPLDVHVQMVFVQGRDRAGCEAMVIDIGERKRLEDALRLSEERYRLLFDRSPLPKWVFDLETLAFLEVNDAAVEHYGYSREEFRHMTFAEICPGESLQAAECVEGKKFEGRALSKHRKKNGEIIDVDAGYTRIFYKGRIAVLGVVVDVTERRRAEREREELIQDLQRSNEELQQFAYVASHDLQEPLRTVAGYVDLLALKYRGKLDAKAEKYISYTVEGVNRMSALINDLLAYSRVGTRGKAFGPVDMNSVFRQATGNLRSLIRETGAAIVPVELPSVKGDETQLVQLLQNLIGNAIKFKKKDVQPRIELTAEQKEDHVIFGVHDNGIGIENRFFDRIFTIFQRLHTREEYPGTGVGLAICKRIVERHRGRIWVESNPGEGSHFYFTLPAA